MNKEHCRFATDVVNAHIDQKRLASTYLVTGSEMLSRENFSLYFANSLVKGSELSFGFNGDHEVEGIRAGNHSDVRVIGDDDVRSLKMEDVREMLKWTYYKPYAAERKVFVMLETQRLTREAANALLKTLEEAPEQTVFILTAETKSQLLETIQSRCFELKLHLCSEDFELSLDDIKHRLKGIGRTPWEELFEDLGQLERNERNAAMEDLLYYCRLKMKEVSDKNSDWEEVSRWANAFDHIYQTYEALESNANSKLAMTRVAMQMKREWN